MRTPLIFLLLVIVVAGGLFLAGVFDPADGDGDPAKPSEPDGAGTNGTTGLSGTNGALHAVPKERPPLEQLAFPEGTKILNIGAIPNTPDVFLTKIEAAAEGVSFHGWYLTPPTEALPQGMSNGLPPLESMPTGLTLNEHDYDVVTISNVDPRDLPDDFWEVLAERVRSGATSVLWRAWPPYPGGESGAPAMDHAWFAHPVISTLLPVKSALPLAGVTDASGQTHVPGNFGATPRRFVLTAVGESHPASRLVPWVEWSRVWWDEISTGKGALGVRFCVPVTKLADGAEVLLAIDRKDSDDIPALVAGKVGDGRVLWLGTRELAWEAFYDPVKEARLGAVINNMLAWLAGSGAK